MERYHAPLRAVFSSWRLGHPFINHYTCLCLNLKVMSDTMGLSGLVPALHLFTDLPSLPVYSTAYPLQQEIMRALQTEHEEMDSIVAQSRIAQVVSSKRPRAHDIGSVPGRKYASIEKGQHGGQAKFP